MDVQAVNYNEEQVPIYPIEMLNNISKYELS